MGRWRRPIAGAPPRLGCVYGGAPAERPPATTVTVWLKNAVALSLLFCLKESGSGLAQVVYSTHHYRGGAHARPPQATESTQITTILFTAVLLYAFQFALLYFVSPTNEYIFVPSDMLSIMLPLCLCKRYSARHLSKCNGIFSECMDLGMKYSFYVLRFREVKRSKQQKRRLNTAKILLFGYGKITLNRYCELCRGLYKPL